MPKYYPHLPPDMANWALSQPVFFISTSPTSVPSLGRHINVSPKGLSSLSFLSLSPLTTLAYVDRTGSGVETLAHVYDNGICTIMFCSFGPAPRVLRLYCRMRRVVERGDDGFADEVRAVLRLNARRWGEDGQKMDEKTKEEEVEVPPAARAVITFEAFEIKTSCGFGVPQIKPELYSGSLSPSAENGDDGDGDGSTNAAKRTELSCFAPRPTLTAYSTKLEAKEGGRGVEEYQDEWNARSVDGMPGLRRTRMMARTEKGGGGEKRRGGVEIWVEDARWKVTRFGRVHGTGAMYGLLLALMAAVAGWMAGVVRVQLDGGWAA